MNDDLIPQWAVELTKQVTILNERLPTHIDWTERNIKDHEARLRALEIAGAKSAWVPALVTGIVTAVGSGLAVYIITHLPA